MLIGVVIIALLIVLFAIFVFLDKNAAEINRDQQFLDALKTSKVHYMANPDEWEELPLKDVEVNE